MNVATYFIGTSGSETACSPVGMRITEKTTEIGRSRRTMSGRIVRDITATKKTFVLNYGETTGDVLKFYRELYETSGELSFVESHSNDGLRNYTVQMEPLDIRKISGRGATTYEGRWSFTVTFTEV